MTRSIIGIAAALWATACGSDSFEMADIGEQSQPIIGGFHTESPLWNHTGALMSQYAGQEEPSSFCTATLVSPDTVVTAKHCIDSLFLFGAPQVAWAAGPNSDDPLEFIPIVGIEAAEQSEGGFVGRGIDVAVAHLEFPSSFAPATVAPLTDEHLGQRMIALGYGVHGADYVSDGRRRLGRQTVAQLEGSAFEGLFGDLESYAEWYQTGQVTDEVFDTSDPFVRELYEQRVLLEGHEAVTGTATLDTQICRGDSGGPLGRMLRDGSFQSYGVASGGLYSRRKECDYGAVYATFGPEALEFVEKAQQWQDPCGDVTGSRCTGTTLVRCETNLPEGRRELTRQNCVDSGQLCVDTDAGSFCGTIGGLGSPDSPR